MQIETRIFRDLYCYTQVLIISLSAIELNFEEADYKADIAQDRSALRRIPDRPLSYVSVTSFIIYPQKPTELQEEGKRCHHVNMQKKEPPM